MPNVGTRKRTDPALEESSIESSLGGNSACIFTQGAIPSIPVSRAIQKTIFTVNIGPNPGELYAPEICDLTYPLLKAYARKIGADFQVIKERKFPEWPVVYEKLQVHELGRDSDWSIVIDSDALISPEMFDPTDHLKKDTVLHNGRDMAGVRWAYDQYFRRDGRNIGSCNWFTIGSDWCLDLWRPLDDLTLEQALKNIHITIGEYNSGCCKTDHLIDDYTLSRNISRFGLKFDTLVDMCGRLGWRGANGVGISPYLYHIYTVTHEVKVKRLLAILSTPQAQPAFEEKGGEIVTGPEGPVMRMPDGRVIAPCGGGWGLWDQKMVAEYKEKWGMK